MFSNHRAPWTGPLRDAALAHPAVTEGLACEGTAVEKRTIKVNGKAFLFLGLTDALLKLDASLPDARAVAATSPKTCRVGAGGWVKLTAPISARRITAWIAESFALASAPRAAARAKPSARAKIGPVTPAGPTPRRKTR